MKFKLLILAILVLILSLVGPEKYKEFRTYNKIHNQIDQSVKKLSSVNKVRPNRKGFIQVSGQLDILEEKHIQDYLKKKSFVGAKIWDLKNHSKITISALGLDGKHHFVNSYLLGYEPFKTTKIWVPLYTLALRKHYQFDHLQYNGLQEVWQNSWQAYYFTRGDCEDHSLILADWMIEMGIDARVVLGRYKKEGHAWVVFLLDGKTYLLEATNKKVSRRAGKIPLASIMVDYHPQFQFNRDKFWINQGSLLTTKYAGPDWIEKSRFIENMP